MKLATLSLGMAAIALCQPPQMTHEQATGCAQDVISNTVTRTVTCYHVDKKLAALITELVIASRDGKALTDISNKLDALLTELEQQPSVGIDSFGHKGGVTAERASINQADSALPPRRIPQDQKSSIIALLSESPGKIRVGAPARDPEAYRFAQDWYEVLKAATWQMEDAGVRVFMPTVEPPAGILVKLRREPAASGEEVEILNDSPEGHLAAALKQLVDFKDLAAEPHSEDFVFLRIGPHPQGR